MTKLRLSFAVLLVLMFGTSSLLAQGGTGQISGTITDSVGNGALPGASIYLKGTSLGASTDLYGKYTLRAVPVGSYAVVVRFIGYKGKEQSVDVKQGTTLELNFSLVPQAVEGQEVVVTVQARGQEAAINQQLSSNTITNVVSAERIHELPDASAATALSRLPGVSLMNGDQVVIRGIQAKLNTVLINGIQIPSTDMTDRASNLGFISSNLLAGIEVIKALTPDMDANTIGGVVNLKLREAPSEFHSDVFVQGLYDTKDHTSDNYKVWGSASYRFLGDNLGVFLQGNADKTDGGLDMASANFQFLGRGNTNYGQAPYIMQNFVFTDQYNVTTNGGGSLIMDYRLPHGKIVMQNTYTGTQNNNTNFTNTLNFDVTTRNYSLFRNNYGKDLMINALQSEYNFGDIKGELTLSHSYADQFTRNRYGDPGNPFGFQNVANVHPYGITGTGLPVQYTNQRQFFTPYVVEHLYLDPTDAYQASVQGWIVQRTEAFAQHVYNSSLDFTVPVTFSENIASKFKVGGRFVRTTRGNNVEAYFRGSYDPDYYNATKNFFPSHLDLSPSNPVMFTDVWNQDWKRGSYFLKGDYPYLYPYNRDLMDLYMKTSITGWAQARHMPYSERDDFSGAEIFSAGYVMGSFDFGPRLSVIGGARLEHYNMDYHGRFVVCTHVVYGYGVEFDTLNRVNRNNDDVFPNVQVRYKFNDWSDLRLAYTKGISRPDYNAIMPSVYYEPGGFAIAGNTLLQPAISTNYDASLSFYNNEIGLLTVGGFYKRIANVFYQSSFYFQNLKHYNVSFPDSSTWKALGLQQAQWPTPSQTINTFLNNPNPARVRGLEVEWQTNFWWLPKPLNSVVLNLNYTHAWSDMDYQQIRNIDSAYTDPNNPRIVQHAYLTRDTIRNARLLFQSNDVFNAAVGGDYKGFSARLSFNLQGNVITTVGSRPEEDQFTGNILRWDITIQQALPFKGFKVIFDGVNIFNNPTYTYQDFRRDPTLPVVRNQKSITYAPRTFQLSVRYSL